MLVARIADTLGTMKRSLTYTAAVLGFVIATQLVLWGPHLILALSEVL